MLQVANITDMVFSSGVVLFLVLAGPILKFDTPADEASYAMFLSWLLGKSFFFFFCGAKANDLMVCFVWVEDQSN